ncbi:hypothetical protein [Jannaschia sp. 2305UL9-9]
MKDAACLEITDTDMLWRRLAQHHTKAGLPDTSKAEPPHRFFDREGVLDG